MSFIGPGNYPTGPVVTNFSGRYLYATPTATRSVAMRFPDIVAYYTCGPSTCPTTGDDARSWRVPVSDPTFGDDFPTNADFYSIGIGASLWSGTMQGSDIGCHSEEPVFPFPPNEACGSYDEAGNPIRDRYSYDIEIHGGMFVATDGSDAPLAYGFTEGTAPEFNIWPPLSGPAQLGTNLHPQRIAYLVNPVPAFPVPDKFGNTFGRCLFKLEQIPEYIELAAVAHYRIGGIGSLYADITPFYYAGLPIPTLAVAPASPGARKRRYITGQFGPSLQP